ncbi:NAD(P)-binding protein [Biscogniauxia marginata]|nr:NAD(P)-binding protein [Biscogniauxia marginata]
MALDTRFALVTGCGHGGIGEALVQEYALAGIHPIATVLPSEPSEHLTRSNITWFTLDVTREESIIQLKKHIFDLTGGRLHILVNNAGICYTMPAVDTDITPVQKMFDVNVFGPMRILKHFHNMLIDSGGTIVNIGSVGGIVPYIYGASYNASKAALHHWANTLRLEMAPLGVKVLTVISGEIGTNILKSDYSRELPDGSYFTPLAPEFRAHVQRTPKTTDRFEYAANVVSQSLKSSPPAWFWYGKTTAIVRFFDVFAPRTIWDYILWVVFSCAKLKGTNRSSTRVET